jgi:adenylate kinase family enzyme
MRRVAVVGSPESGKSTVSVELGRTLELPCIGLDAFLAAVRMRAPAFGSDHREGEKP